MCLREKQQRMDIERKLGVLQILEAGERVVSEGAVHNGGAARLLEKDGFHGVVEIQRHLSGYKCLWAYGKGTGGLTEEMSYTGEECYFVLS
jgi:hypothetical protein